MPARPTGTRTVLQILPHPGGGGETYVDRLAEIPGFASERTYVATGPEVRQPLRLIASSLRVCLRSRRYDLVHVHGEVAAFLCLPALARQRSVVTLHGSHLLRRSTGITRRLAALNLRVVIRLSNRTIAVSQAELDEVTNVVGPSLARRVSLVRNGIALPDLADRMATRRAVRDELGISESTVLALCVGDLTPVKDPLTPARATLAVAKETDIVTCFAGEGPLRVDLERLEAESGRTAIRLLGHRSDLVRLYAAADVIVLASLREGLPFSLLEGMAAGLAPIVSDEPGSVEAAGADALVVPRGDAGGFAEALRRLTSDPVERDRRGRHARERIAEQFGPNEMIARTEALYDAVLR